MRYREAKAILEGRKCEGYATALKKPNPNRQSVKIANNTYLERRDPRTFAVRLHATDVVTITPRYVELNTGGWFTVTTKERINSAAPVRIASDCGQWYAWLSRVPGGYPDWNDKSRRTRFFDGLRVSPDGTRFLNAKPDTVNEKAVAEAEAMKKRINAFVSLAIKELREGLAMPGGGDCWYCAMQTDAGASLGDAVSDTSHLAEHMTEGYVVPSLLWNAVKETGYRFPEVILGAHENGDGYRLGGCVVATYDGKPRPRAIEDSVRRSLRRYLKKRLVKGEQS
jgi:hypothetical protein